MCVGESAEQSTANEGEQGVGADLEQELDNSSDEETPERSTGSTTSSSDAEEQSAGRRLSEQDAAEAIENAGKTALAPVTSFTREASGFHRGEAIARRGFVVIDADACG